MKSALIMLGYPGTASPSSEGSHLHVRGSNQSPMRVFSLIAGIIVLLFLVFERPAHAQQEITVRFLNCESGKPIKNLKVEVTLRNGESPQASVANRTELSKAATTTDADGRVTVKIMKAVPEHISIFAPDLVQPVGPRLSPPEILRSGAVVPCRQNMRASDFQVSSKPGEIIVLNKRLTAWDRMRREIP